MGEHQKNWSVFKPNDSTKYLFITHASPIWRIASINKKTPEWISELDIGSKLEEYKFCYSYKIDSSKSLRCTSPGVPFTKHTHLTLLHIYNPYRLVFCEFNSTYPYHPIKISKPISLNSNRSRIEYPSGLTKRGKHFYIGLGVKDNRCQIHKISKYRIVKRLIYIL